MLSLRRFVTTTRESDVQQSVVLRTYINPKEPSKFGNWPIWQAARATSAAPWYFDPIEVPTVTPNGVWHNRFVDGGLQANNPSLL